MYLFISGIIFIITVEQKLQVSFNSVYPWRLIQINIPQEYHTRLAEEARFPKSVLTVEATDPDTGEHGLVTYTLGGEGALLFVINETTGEVCLIHLQFPVL